METALYLTAFYVDELIYSFYTCCSICFTAGGVTQDESKMKNAYQRFNVRYSKLSIWCFCWTKEKYFFKKTLYQNKRSIKRANSCYISFSWYFVWENGERGIISPTNGLIQCQIVCNCVSLKLKKKFIGIKEPNTHHSHTCLVTMCQKFIEVCGRVLAGKFQSCKNPGKSNFLPLIWRH